MAKLLIYSHDTYGLGNIRRMLGIASFLSCKHPDLAILLVSGSPMLHAFRIPPQIDYVKLPCLGRLQTGEYISAHIGVSVEQVLRTRANILKSTISGYQPDIVLVDKKPLGLEGELGPALQARKQSPQQPRQVLLLRDILDSPDTTRTIWQKNGYYDAIDALYDRVLVVGNQSIFDVAENYAFPPSVRDKTRYCGYLKRRCSQQSVADTQSELGLSANDKLVLATVGGGADGTDLLSCYLQGLKDTKTTPGYHSLLLCGSEMPAEHRARLEATAARLQHVQIREFTDDIMRYMEAADVVVSMGGYNTLCEILTLKKNAIVVPRTAPVREQCIRAERMAALGLIQTIHPDLLTPQRLADAVKTALAQDKICKSKLYRIDMDGLSRIEEEILYLLDPVSQTASPDSVSRDGRRAATGSADQPVSLAKE